MTASAVPDVPDVSVVIVSFNTRELLAECLTSLEQMAGGVRYEAIVVDNASRDQSAERVERDFPQVRLLRSKVNLGFAAANNLGFQHCRGRYVVLLNSDAFLRADALPLAVQRMDAHPDVGLAGGLLLGRDDSWQPSARQFPSLLNDFLSLSGLSARFARNRFLGRQDRTWADPHEAAAVDWVPGAFSIIRRDVLEKIGYFDERFFLYYEEVDLCRRIRAAGFTVQYWPEIVVTHIGGESSRTVSHLTLSGSGAQLTLWRLRSAYLYYRKHHGAFGVWSARLLEAGWHGLRQLRNRRRSPAKAEESAALLTLIRRAWKDTQGGRVSPPRPW